MKCLLHAEALAEYRQATLYYGKRGRKLGEAFTTEVETAIATIQASPRARAANEQTVRRYLLKRFPYILHYVIEQESTSGGSEFIIVYAVRHSRRDQTYWLHRLPPASGNV